MSEHIGAEEAQALLDAARPLIGTVVIDTGYPAVDALAAAAPRLAAEVVRLRRELDARTDPELAERLISHVVNDPHVRGLPQMQADVHAAARLLGGGE